MSLKVLFRGVEHKCGDQTMHLYFRIQGDPRNQPREIAKLDEANRPNHPTIDRPADGRWADETEKDVWEVIVIPPCYFVSEPSLLHEAELFAKVVSMGQQEKEESFHPAARISVMDDWSPKVVELTTRDGQTIVGFLVNHLFADAIWPTVQPITGGRIQAIWDDHPVLTLPVNQVRFGVGPMEHLHLVTILAPDGRKVLLFHDAYGTDRISHIHAYPAFADQIKPAFAKVEEVREKRKERASTIAQTLTEMMQLLIRGTQNDTVLN